VVFRRVEGGGGEDWKRDPDYLLMVQRYKDAADKECLGLVGESSELYERALSIRQNVC